jgi:mono/diheme cytochrome c family protein
MVIAIAISIVGFSSPWAGPPDGGSAARVLSESSPSQSDAVPREGALLVQTRCVICHSEDLVAQQRLSRAQWDATVSKMVRWGAPLSASEQRVLAEYLASRYPPDASEGKTK